VLAPLLVLGALGGLLGAIDADRSAGRLIALAFLCVSLAGLVTPAFVYRSLFARRLVIERQIDAAQQCTKCGYNLEGLFTPTCPECGWTPPVNARSAPGENP
jgi:lipopolysaccharide biosynthesis regulator YciM